ncbi:hypothetical protein DPMN_117343 [Dreissena polymorpha]|uniref:Mitochondria-eating protein C-terminal domain-containing protein n=1 Tax=Dreissena polymorpha TaxID=45954 RepID=A0A9D4QV42_DREPO|nr:hypothetical protein DPMN_117343 [Dreissena polymorpha]
MVIQDPPVSMDTRTSQPGELFDGAVYRPYTKSGRYVEFIVWPALFLTETGPLLYKGVAQGTDKYQQYSDWVDNDVNTNKQSSSNTSHKYPNENERCAIEHLSAEKENMTQTVSSNVQQERKAQSVKGVDNSVTGIKHTTSVPVLSPRMKNIPVDVKQVKKVI